MLQTIFKGIGGLARDIVEAGETVVDTVMEVGNQIDEAIASAPRLIEEGYHEGLITDGDNAPKEVDISKVQTKPLDGNGFVKPDVE